MNQWVTSLMIRVFSGGIICAAALILAGDGAKKEIVRLCCACLMVVFILTPIQGADFNLSEIFEAPDEVEAQIDRALDTVRQQEVDQVIGQLADHIESRAARLGIQCRARLESLLENGSTLHITAIYLECHGGSESARAQLVADVAAYCGVNEAVIDIREAQVP